MAIFRVLVASMLLAGGQVVVAADDAAPAPGAVPYGPQSAYAPAPYAGGPYGGGYGGAPYARAPYGGAPYGGGPYGGAPYGGGYGGGPFGGGGPFNGGGPFGGGGGPFSGGSPMRGVPFMQSFDMSRPDSFNPMRRQVWGRGPEAWVNPWDPKEGMSDAWDDMMNAPHRMGRVPPGWKAPSIDIPNPIDVGDEFEKNARRAPTIMRDNFTFN
ncbi:MAG: hypothetical protein LJE59_13160 [Chromatiaceae bacterium]|jgi:hypothetical protein|nr:hypothetical protein [Chromatiaceae bacterium]